MFSPKTLLLFGMLVPFTLAQYGGAPAPAPASAKTTTPAAAAAAAASTTSSSAAATQTVVAGAGGVDDLSWTPNTVTAAVGTFVEFQFMPDNHSVAESTFAAPCSPTNTSSFFAGFQFFTTTGPAPNVFTLQINSTDPIWFYCPQTTFGIHHCTSGMVGVINPPSGQNGTTFQAAAAASNVTVAVPPQIQGGVIAAASAASSSAASSAATASATPTGAASHLTVEMGFMGLIGVVFSALLSF